MKSDSLLKRVSALGFSLFEVEEDKNANLTLADVAKSKDLRLREGFPVVLANSAEKGLFSSEKVNRYLNNPRERSHFASLVVLSLALYKFFNLNFPWADKLSKSLTQERHKELKGFLANLKNSADLKVSGYEMSTQRLKNVFNNYFVKSKTDLNEFLSVKDELSLEYALSQLFSPKQKELLFKKLKNEKLTKTENEYFSRVVKKKVLALANTELHSLAQKLLK